MHVTGEKFAAHYAATAKLLHVGTAHLSASQVLQGLAELFRPFGTAGIRRLRHQRFGVQ
jgi:hypothetical protein